MKVQEAFAAVRHAVEPVTFAAGAPLQFRPTAALLTNSIGLGMVLALVTYIAARKNDGADLGKVKKTLGGAGNLLFLCVGLTGTMILVNNNMVRAFAIGAAIALVRFKIKLDGKSANASLLFAILAGIACGLGEIALAWTLLVTFVVLVTIVSIVTRLVTTAHVADATPPEPAKPLIQGTQPGVDDTFSTLVMRRDAIREALSTQGSRN